MEPSELLEDLGMILIVLKDPLVRFLCRDKVFLLLIHVPNLEPDILLLQRPRWIMHDVSKAIQAQGVLLALLVNYAQAEINLVRLVKVRVHAQDLRECFFSMVERAVAVIKNTNAVPELGFFWVPEVVEGLLVGGVGFREVVHHEITVAKRAPDLAIATIEVEDAIEVVDGLGILLLCPQDTRNCIHGPYRVGVMLQRRLVRQHGSIQISNEFRQASKLHPNTLIHAL